MSEDWRRSQDNREAVVAVAIDLSKAFDSIDHSLLLAKLSAYGLSSSALQLMSSYLTGRKKRVKVHGICSSYRDVKIGVPQGFLLGPLLFNIFINDLNFFVPHMSLRLYVDDTTYYSELSVLSSWFDQNHLLVNNDKTQALPLGPCSYNYDFVLNGIEAGTQESKKILGVALDKMLTFKDHISGPLKKAYAKSAALRRIRRFVSNEVMISLYNSFVLPHFEYCSPLLLGVGKLQASPLEDANL